MTLDDRTVAVARVYADAMLEVAAGRGEADSLGEELAALAGQVEGDATFRAFLSSPLVDGEGRARSLERIFRGRASDLLVDSLQVLNRKGRIGLVPTVAATYARALNARHGRIEVAVTSAVALSDPQRAAVRAAVARRTGRDAILDERIDADLIGGLVVAIGDQKADGSVAAKITRLDRALVERASREVQRGGQVEA